MIEIIKMIAMLLVLFIMETMEVAMLFSKLTLRPTADGILSREDPCISLCEKTPIDFPNNMNSFCQRGCRFFNLVNYLHYGWGQNNFNGTKNACKASCSEAYTNQNDSYACNSGCDFMAQRRILEHQFTRFIINKDIDVLATSPDIPENDTLTDPGLRKELRPRWWDFYGFKLPQTFVKTIPTDTRTMDYTLFSNYSGKTRQLASKFESFEREMERAKDKVDLLCIYYAVLQYSNSSEILLIFTVITLIIETLYYVYQTEVYLLMPCCAIFDRLSPASVLFISDETVMYEVPSPTTKI